jgi:dynein heavy chain, axonemal
MDKTEWLNGSFIKLISTNIEKKIDTYLRDTLRIQKIFMDSQEENAFKITSLLKDDIEKFKENLWLVDYLTQEAFQKKPIYWRDLFRECDLIYIEPSLDMSLAQLIEHGLVNHRERVEDLAMRAEKQWGIEKKLTEIQEKVLTR